MALTAWLHLQAAEAQTAQLRDELGSSLEEAGHLRNRLRQREGDLLARFGSAALLIFISSHWPANLSCKLSKHITCKCRDSTLKSLREEVKALADRNSALQLQQRAHEQRIQDQQKCQLDGEAAR